MAEKIATKKQESADKRERKEKLKKQMVNFEGMIATAPTLEGNDDKMQVCIPIAPIISNKIAPVKNKKINHPVKSFLQILTFSIWKIFLYIKLSQWIRQSK
jgi:hypothetical protein